MKLWKESQLGRKSKGLFMPEITVILDWNIIYM